MNTPTVVRDLSDYLRLVWGGKHIVAAVTLACVIVMAAFTWTMPTLYLVVAEVNAGVLAQVQPRELNLLVEAVDRSQFVVEGGMFPETTPKVLTVTFRSPWTIRLAAITADVDSALRRLRVLTTALEGELEKRYRAYADARARTEQRAHSLPSQVSAQLLDLRHNLNQRAASAAATSRTAKADAARAITFRVSIQSAAEARWREPLLLCRDRLVKENRADSVAFVDEILAALHPDVDVTHTDNTVAAVERSRRRTEALARIDSMSPRMSVALSRALQQISAVDGQIARAMSLYNSAEPLRQATEQGLTVLGRTHITDANRAREVQHGLGELYAAYSHHRDPIAPWVQEAVTSVGDLANALQAGEVARREPVLKPPVIAAQPTLVDGPVYPRPFVNLAIACLFGLAASILFVTLTARVRLQSAT